MKQVLIIANLEHSRQRVSNLTKYLHEFNWNAITFTPEGQGGTIETKGYQSSYKQHSIPRRIPSFLKRLYKPFKEILQYPDNETEWVPHALETAKQLFKTYRIDAVISTSSPVTCHLIAKAIKKKYGLPWIADFRDLWTQNHNYPYSQLRRWRERKLEVETLQSVDALVTVSGPWASKLGELHKRKEVYSIPNSYDPDEYDFIDPPLTSKFTVTYTGQIYERQELNKFLNGLTWFLANHHHLRYDDNMEVRFIGSVDPSLLPSFIKYLGVLPRKEVILKQRESQVLLLLKFDGNDCGWYSLKLFDYLGARRPVLAVGGNHDVISDLLEETEVGAEAYSPEEVTTKLQAWYDQFIEFGQVAYRGNGEVSKYNAREMARKYSEVLNQQFSKLSA